MREEKTGARWTLRPVIRGVSGKAGFQRRREGASFPGMENRMWKELMWEDVLGIDGYTSRGGLITRDQMGGVDTKYIKGANERVV